MNENRSTKKPVNSYWTKSANDLFAILNTSEQGLSSEEAARRMETTGPNTLNKKRDNSSIILFLQQFKSPITLLLIATAILSAFLGDISDMVIILIIVLVSGVLGFRQEKGANKAVQELLKMVQLHFSGIRDGQKQEIPFESAVPGDIISLTTGDIIPADSLLLQSNQLFVDEAAFTGESFPVEKKTGIVDADSPIAKRTNTLFMGSNVVSGSGTALIVHTGQNTEFGHIASKLQQRIPETNFEKGIRKFGYLLVQLTLLFVLGIFAVNILLHKPPIDSLLFSLALAVGLTPQLLPAIISINLSSGAIRMVAKNVVVKRLSSIENLGGMNVLCSDKTGTLTEGTIRLKEATDAAGNASDKTAQYAVFNASLQAGFRNPIDIAIMDAFPERTKTIACPCCGEIPYDFIRKRLSVQLSTEGQQIMITKGAFNNVLEICDKMEINGQIQSLDDNAIDKITQIYQQYGNDGVRALGIAYKSIDNGKSISRSDEEDMTFLGFVTFFDPPKPGIEDTVQKLKNAGVNIKIITGDNAMVSRHLAQVIGIDEPKIITGSQLQNMSNAALYQQVKDTHVFAEMEPSQKERVVAALKFAGFVVGYMGDGINDAPALHTADVGISVDSAVDVAKQAADIVLLKRDLNVLLNGVIEGRRTFSNTLKYIFMAASANFGNMFSMAGASLFLPFLPLLPKQILLTNLLTDLPESTIAKDNVDEIALAKPLQWDIRLIKWFMVCFGLLSSIFDYLTFGVLLKIFHAGERFFQTGWFTESVVSAVMVMWVVRTRLPFTQSKPGKWLVFSVLIIALLVLLLPFTPVASIFGFEVLPWYFYIYLAGIVVAYVLSAELLKKWFYKRMDKMMLL